MLELNKWFFAQLANFLLLLIILNIILFKPLLRIFKERDEGINGALNKAKSMDKEKDSIMAQIDAKLSEGRTKAKTTFEELSKQGLEVQKQALTAAQNEAAVLNNNAKAELESAVEKARASLKSDVEAFSKQIVEKLVKA
jgi:F-type H+-transporting ATPase subunit b